MEVSQAFEHVHGDVQGLRLGLRLDQIEGDKLMWEIKVFQLKFVTSSTLTVLIIIIMFVHLRDE
jgi:hypothetical protein